MTLLMRPRLHPPAPRRIAAAGEKEAFKAHEN